MYKYEDFNPEYGEKSFDELTKGKMPVVITTEYKGVFFGYINPEDFQNEHIIIYACKMILYWGTTEGLFELIEKGCNDDTKTSMTSSAFYARRVTSVAIPTPAAIKTYLARYKK